MKHSFWFWCPSYVYFTGISPSSCHSSIWQTGEYLDFLLPTVRSICNQSKNFKVCLDVVCCRSFIRVWANTAVKATSLPFLQSFFSLCDWVCLQWLERALGVRVNYNVQAWSLTYYCFMTQAHNGCLIIKELMMQTWSLSCIFSPV
jgi:hypothetical protein